MKDINILIIGLGPHAKKTYLTEFELLKTKNGKSNIFLCGVVDFESKKTEIESYISKFSVVNNFGFLAAPARLPGKDYNLPRNFIKDLDQFCFTRLVNTVFIATEPISHYTYIKWALTRNMHIFLDKPITLHTHSSTNVSQAQKIIDDYCELSEIYRKTQTKEYAKPVIFSCLAQRRYHPAFLDMKRYTMKISKLTNCPITSIIASHCDGQWRFPDELLTQSYHGYDDGVGKLSHSGYHLLDIIPWLIKGTDKSDLKINKVIIQTKFIRPYDIARQLSIFDLKKILGNKFKSEYFNYESELLQKLKKFGEVDAHINLIFGHNDVKITSINLMFLHQSFSGRTWINTEKDPLINKGRLKQEIITLYQGPFFSAHYRCIRAGLGKKYNNYDNGGLLHTEADYFFNTDLIGIKQDRIKHVKYMTDNPPYTLQETSRSKCVQEFLLAVENFGIREIPLASPFSDHRISTLLMSEIYKAAAKEYSSSQTFNELKINL